MRFSSGFYNMEAKMIRSSYNTVFIYLYVSIVFNPSHGFDVNQPQNKIINPDKTVSISCEHTADPNSVLDVRLNKVRANRSLLCQKGMDNCKNIIMYNETSDQDKWIFILFNLGPDAMTFEYECEVTAKENDIDNTKRGTPTKLLALQTQGQPAEPTPLPPSLQSHHLTWILIGLLTLMFVYSCVITSFYMRLMNTSKDCENATYVEMRNVPVQRNPDHIYNTAQKSKMPLI
ncbi:uncharacterized protein LOC115801085 [Archocentrus centrarchus]|uniref:uncharacterized protein LOC115801085 n=1 Tax=Archocentrus centrarchus TaxID=63155 RepID=UPI0011E9C10F|nr:uncharacterized protein LOC115801085 [Archocentrus centrarchus]